MRAFVAVTAIALAIGIAIVPLAANAAPNGTIKAKNAAITAGQRSCKALRASKPKPGAQRFAVTFVNKSEGGRFAISPADAATLTTTQYIERGQSFKTTARAGEAWVFTDGPGNCIEALRIKAGTSRYAVTAPSPAFGPGND
jgi:hypothetical protein